MKQSSSAWKEWKLKIVFNLKPGTEACVDHETNKSWKGNEEIVKSRFMLHALERWWQQENLVSNWEEIKTREWTKNLYLLKGNEGISYC